MKVDVTEYEKQYTFALEPVTQLCGQNIVKKTYIMESLRRYFSTYKYREEKNKWRDNVKINDEVVGRKYFSVLSISGMADLLQMIKWSKQSLMTEYVKQLIQKFNGQVYLRAINDELDGLFQMLNEDINRLGDIELTYDISEMWDMVQKSNITGTEQTLLEDKSNYELFLIFMNLIEAVMISNPRKMLIIIENMDHFLSKEEYGNIIERMRYIATKFDIQFIVSISLEGYVRVDKELCTGITVFGDCDFQMPEYEKISKYVHENYPCYKQFSEEQIQNMLENIIQRVGEKDFLSTVEENIICKLINRTLMIDEGWSGTECMPEIAFLKS